MTIIKPSIYAQNARFIMFLLSFILIAGISYIFMYNALVNARYQVSSLKNQIAEAVSSNNGLKGKLFKETDPSKLQTLAARYNLVPDTKPEYLTVHQWVSDSSF